MAQRKQLPGEPKAKGQTRHPRYGPLAVVHVFVTVPPNSDEWL
ncbi:MAG: hypothetical protein NTX52_02895 [Planctomycetota bacterium]|nr:hypothetical protein [Planctomycetota bacterium]